MGKTARNRVLRTVRKITVTSWMAPVLVVFWDIGVKHVKKVSEVL